MDTRHDSAHDPEIAEMRRRAKIGIVLVAIFVLLILVLSQFGWPN